MKIFLVFEIFILMVISQRALNFGEGVLHRIDDDLRSVRCGLMMVDSLNRGLDFYDDFCTKYLDHIKVYTRINHQDHKPNYFFRVVEND